MDKKNLTIGVLLLIAAFASMFLSQRLAPPPPPAPEIAPIATGTAPEAGAPSTSTPVYTPPSNATFAAMQDVEFEAKERLVNEFIEVRLSNVGGAVQEVAMKKYPITKDQPAPFVFNAQRAGPIFGLTAESRLGPAIDPTHGLNTTPFEVVSATSTEVVYRTVLNGELEITRRYRLPSGEDPYRIHHETVFRNLSNKALAPQPVLSLGTAALVDANDVGQYLNVTTYNGEDANVIDRGEDRKSVV